MVGIAIFLLGTTAITAEAATFTVNSMADPGDGVCDASCTLRDAIVAANTSPGQDTIDFSGIVLPTDTVPVTITLADGLPTITDSVLMDASITETRSLPGNPVLRPGVELDMSAVAVKTKASGIFPPLTFFPNGLNLKGSGADSSEIRGFIINGFTLGVPVPSMTSIMCLFPVLNPDPLDVSAPEIDFCGYGISLFGVNNVKVAGNYINLDKHGVAISGAGRIAISVVDGSNNIIGGNTTDDRNVISSNDLLGLADLDSLIQLLLTGWSDPALGEPKITNNNKLIGNYLGVNAEGVAHNPEDTRPITTQSHNIPDNVLLPGSFGWGAQCATSDPNVPGHCEMKDNVIEGNTITNFWRPAIELFGYSEGTIVNDNTIFNTGYPLGGGGQFAYVEAATFESSGLITPLPKAAVNLIISNNRLGLDGDGLPASGIAGRGIFLTTGAGGLIENNTITRTSLGGVSLRDWTSYGEPGVPNNITISQNSIYESTLGNELYELDFLVGIDLQGPDEFGVTANDFQDVDSGVNNFQNFPELIYAKEWQGDIRIHGQLNSAPNKNYRIEFFANDTVDASGHGEGERYLGSVDVSTNGSGNAVVDSKGAFELEFGTDIIDAGHFVTSTATLLCTPNEPEIGNCPHGTSSTSEFSAAVEVTH
jgi:CSLREA domain-containing protein